jgi:hypothetical protein
MMLALVLGCIPEGGVVANWETQLQLDPTALNFGTGFRSGTGRFTCDPSDESYGDDIGAYMADCDAQDGLGELIFGYVRVFNDSDDLPVGPVQGITVDIQSQLDTLYLIPAGAVQIVEDVLNACLEDSTTEGCDDYFFDTRGQQYFQIADSYTNLADDGGPFLPNYLRAPSNERGLIEFFIFVDSAPPPGNTSSVTATTGWQSATMIVATDG